MGVLDRVCHVFGLFIFMLKYWFLVLAMKFHKENRVKKQGIKSAESRQGHDDKVPYFNDSFYFHGSSSVTGFGIFARLGIRKNRSEGWLILSHPELGVFNFNSEELEVEESRHPHTGPLKFTCLEPMKKWLVSFDGDCKGPDGEIYHLSVEFEWNSITGNKFFDFDTDISSKPLAWSMAYHPWSIRYFRELKATHQVHYEQFGQMDVFYKIKNEALDYSGNEQVIGMRDHSFGPRDWGYMHRWVVLFGYVPASNLCFHVTWVDHPLSRKIVLGYVWTKEGFKKIEDITPDLDSIGEENCLDPPTHFDFKFRLAGSKIWNEGSVQVEKKIPFDMAGRSVFYEQFAKFSINGEVGDGICEFNYGISHRNKTNWPQKSKNLDLPSYIDVTDVDDSSEDENPNIFWLDAESKRKNLVELIGGKALGLNALFKMKASYPPLNVPQGFCVTSSAFKRQMEFAEETTERLSDLIETLSQQHFTDIAEAEEFNKEVSREAQEMMLEMEMEEEIRQQIKESYSVMSSGRSSVCVAVRSSATAEDLPSASFAGQHDTLLGIVGVDEVLLAVKQIWASLWSHRAISYRQSKGIPHFGLSMCVVVQEFIEAESSGVLFTRNPVNHNPNQILLTSSFGLGESIASGIVTPDTFILERLENTKKGNEKVKIVEVSISQKTEEFVLNDDESALVCGNDLEHKIILRQIPDELREKQSLRDEEIEEVARISLQVEKMLGYHRRGVDIEFAVRRSVIYLLQARPITTSVSSDMEKDIRELDTPIYEEGTVYTLHNIGEMLPGAVTPLTFSTFGKALDIAMHNFYGIEAIETWSGNKIEDHMYKFVGMFSGQLFLNLTKLYKFTNNMFGASKKSIDFSLCGYITHVPPPPITDPWITRMKNSSWNLLRFMYNLATVKSKINTLRKLEEKYKKEDSEKKKKKKEDEESEVREHYKDITLSIHHLSIAYDTHLWASAVSATIQGELLHFLGSKSKENNEKLGSIMSNIGDVASAQVLLDTKKIIDSIIHDNPDHIDFLLDKNVPLEDKLSWITTKDSAKTGELFNKFLEEHGYRCYREAEMRQKGWGDDPLPFFVMLLASLKGQTLKSDLDTSKPHTENDEKNEEKIYGEVNSVLRPVFKYGISIAKNAIRQREETKSRTIRITNYIKKKYRKLGKMVIGLGVVREYLTQPNDFMDLIFFFTHQELDRFLDLCFAMLRPHSPEIADIILEKKQREIKEMLERAQARRKVLDEQNKIKFDNLTVPGKVPEPIQEEPTEMVRTDQDFSVQGMGVSQGFVEGTVRVARTIQEASELEIGEILIVPYTDVGWTPFFPLLGALGCELGGVVSHGAVVAREYGLPCIVDLKNACNIFQTGDHVVFDANTGKITKLKE